MTRAPPPSLQCVFWNAEFLRGFPGGITLPLAQEECRAQKRRELLEIFADHLAQLRASENLLRIRAVIGETLRCGQLFLARRFIERYRRPRLGSAPAHQRCLDDDARHPGLKLRTPFQPPQAALVREQSI